MHVARFNEKNVAEIALIYLAGDEMDEDAGTE